MALAFASTALPVAAQSVDLTNERLEPGLYPADPGAPGWAAPEEPAQPPFDLDWSVGLKGTYTSSSREGGSFLTTLNPQFSAVHEGVRTDLTIEGEAEIARNWDDAAPLEVPELRLSLETTTRLDRDTQLSGNAALTVTRDLVSAPGLDPQIDTPPTVISGTAGAGLDRNFGRFTIGISGDVTRTVYGETIRSDTGATSNSDQNVWQADGRLRLGFRATPIFDVFGEAGLGRDAFDLASPTLGVAPDATATSLRGGVTGRWNDILTATASVGIGRHDFDASGLGDITTRLYDASLTYTPNDTLSLTGQLSTEVEPVGADSAGTARIEHVATASAAYTVNSWLRLRASADWTASRLEGTAETETGHGLGAGADYVFNSRTALSADYGYTHRDNSVTGALDTHRLSVGVTIRR